MLNSFILDKADFTEITSHYFTKLITTNIRGKMRILIFVPFLFLVLKTGASGMIAYRFQTKDGGWQWLQTSSRLVYKNSKPDFVLSTHRPLM